MSLEFIQNSHIVFDGNLRVVDALHILRPHNDRFLNSLLSALLLARASDHQLAPHVVVVALLVGQPDLVLAIFGFQTRLSDLGHFVSLQGDATFDSAILNPVFQRSHQRLLAQRVLSTVRLQFLAEV